MKRKKGDHFNLLCDIGELAGLLAGSDNIEQFLQQTVVMVARHLDAPVGSIYLYEEATRHLVLRATVGLNPAAVGKVRLSIGEGLVGKTMERKRHLREGRASGNPHFKFFEEADEARFESFLAVPLIRGDQNIGVLVVQHEQEDYFDEVDAMALRATASQLAGSVENARLMFHFQRMGSTTPVAEATDRLGLIKGESGAAGFALAPIAVFKSGHGPLLAYRPDTEFASTLAGFRKAVDNTHQQLKTLQARLAQRLPESAALIFEAHFMILKDARFVARMAEKIESGLSPPEAVRSVARYYMDLFSSSSSAYLREKTHDIEDLARRILRNLRQIGTDDTDLCSGRIVIARELFPSDVLKLASEDVRGIILVSGGVTSHVAILSRSLQIPLVIADRPDLLDLPDNTPVLVDADMGNIYVNPDREVKKRFQARETAKKRAAETTGPPPDETRTADGLRVHLMANINLLGELVLARRLRADGVGLYRTEFPFLVRSTFPSEEEQMPIYRRLIEEMAGQVVTIRTLDIGGEKNLPYLDSTVEANPELGLRSIRFSLRYGDIFAQQLRAILRAGAGAAQLRIMFPMISSIDELRQARQAVAEAAASLAVDGLEHNPTPKLGMMVELPAVLDIIDDFAAEVDFFSIGTNDFIQYMLAVDRCNKTVADYYRPYHPAVLRGIDRVVRAARCAGKEVAVCGEMGHMPVFITFLIGIGLTRFSVDPQFIPQVRRHLAALDTAMAAAFAAALLKETSLSAMKEILNTHPEACHDPNP
ncbi:MAG: phosphoenolpyruvate--protein phosphotransferase [Desulfobacterales bacterium]|nr:phosphoenolpyruvate--protein phosphotransferase [Desulfobacterales bacterium]